MTERMGASDESKTGGSFAPSVTHFPTSYSRYTRRLSFSSLVSLSSASRVSRAEPFGHGGRYGERRECDENETNHNRSELSTFTGFTFNLISLPSPSSRPRGVSKERATRLTRRREW